jgi:predicted nucleotidyltransferase
MKQRIQEIIEQIEREQDVIILYAAESGSRAWGFASKDSDYDVRFIYKRPLRDYLAVVKKSDVLDKNYHIGHICDDLMDFSGWDIMKAMQLFRASNPAMMEWLDSPVVYMDRGFRHANGRTFAEELRKLSGSVSLKKLGYHYHSLAKGNFERYIKHRDMVTYKKYLYVLRSLFCCFWIEQYNSVPPTDFNVVLDGIEAPAWVKGHLRQIILIKSDLDEADDQPGSDSMNEYINTELTRLIDVLKHNDSELMDQELLNPIIYKEMGI